MVAGKMQPEGEVVVILPLVSLNWPIFQVISRPQEALVISIMSQM
jgi:hypothetical protein